MYLGNFTIGKTVVLFFNTRKADGTPITLAGAPAISVYKNSTTESTSGVTLNVDYDSRTGLHQVVIDTSASGAFYATGNDFAVVITTGTVDSVSAVGTVVGRFSLENRAELRPTTADRTLDVSAGGEAGVDWANVGSPTTAVALSSTTSKLTATGIDEILDDTIGDGTLTVRQALRVFVSALSGKLSGAGTTTITIRNGADSQNVIVATVDPSGNRTAVTVTP